MSVRSVSDSGRPAFEVTRRGRKVALVTFDWESDSLGTCSVARKGRGDGISEVTITLTDPDGEKVTVTLTDSGGKLTSSGDLERVKVVIFQNS